MVLNGVVEGINDPKQLGRVQVRIRGIHTADLKLLPTEALPWCRFLTPIDGGGIYGTKSSPILGASVYLLDLGNGTEFLIIGGLQSKVDVNPIEDLGFKDPSGLYPAQGDLNKSTNPLVKEPAAHPNANNLTFPATGPAASKITILGGVKYPYNNVYYDQQQNILEVDASPGAPRIRLQHSSGSKIEFDTHGNVIVTAAKNISVSSPGLFAINQEDNNIIIKGDLKVEGNTEVTEKISAGSDITSSGEVADNSGNLSSLRDAYDGHNHVQGSGDHFGAGGVTTIPDKTDPLNRVTDFGWSGKEI